MSVSTASEPPRDHAALFPKIVLTGGPGAGKTAIQKVATRELKSIVAVPESASILFGGGFPRRGSELARQATQRGIFWVQRELEALHVADAPLDAVLLCDRGTVDGSAYWTGEVSLWDEVGTTIEAELGRYHTVIHLLVPDKDDGYNNINPLRTESAAEAARIDARITDAWRQHPRVFTIESTGDFMSKVNQAMTLIGDAVARIRAADRYVPGSASDRIA